MKSFDLEIEEYSRELNVRTMVRISSRKSLIILFKFYGDPDYLKLVLEKYYPEHVSLFNMVTVLK